MLLSVCCQPSDRDADASFGPGCGNLSPSTTQFDRDIAATIGPIECFSVSATFTRTTGRTHASLALQNASPSERHKPYKSIHRPIDNRKQLKFFQNRFQSSLGPVVLSSTNVLRRFAIGE
jgi:hypothetical protein